MLEREVGVWSGELELVEKLSILFRKEMRGYDFGEGHPFRGSRFSFFLRDLKKQFDSIDYEIVESGPAELEDLLMIADKDYIEFTANFFNSEKINVKNSEFNEYHSRDNLPRNDSGRLEEIARLVVGQAKEASELVIDGHEIAISVGGGFHHAKPNWGEGFCIYNDVAFAVKHLLNSQGIDRVMVLDTDAHFGNGTYEYFMADPRVLQVDLHQDPTTIYPGSGFVNQTGEGDGEGYTINIPMPEFAGDDSYQLVFDEVVEPVVEEFEPQVVIRNGGGDPYVGDRLTSLGLSIGGLRMIGSRVRDICRKIDSGLVDLIVSGYSGERLHLTWLALISGLAEKNIDFEESESFDLSGEPLEETRKVVEKARDIHGELWGF